VTGTGSVRDERLGTRPLAGLALDDLQNPARAVTGGDVPGDVLVVGQHDAAAGDAEQPHTGVGDLVEGTQQVHLSGVEVPETPKAVAQRYVLYRHARNPRG
jgi:hypothetical protein